MPAARKPRKPKAKPRVDLVSRHGPAIAPRVMVEMPAELAAQMFELSDGIEFGASRSPVAAVERDLDAVRKSDAALADSGLAASVLWLAAELCNPYNSATSKAMCAREIRDTLGTLRELCPPERKRDGIDEIAKQREERRRRAAG